MRMAHALLMHPPMSASLSHSGSLEISATQQDAIDALGKDERSLPAPLALARRAYLSNDALERAEASADLAAFWDERTRLVEWIAPWREVYRFSPPDHAWFLG